ncbi:hypothetical protein V8E52_002940 [Russula decolorans]
MPCELGVASLSAPRPASLGLLSILCLGILAAGLLRVLAADRAAFEIPFAFPPPLARLGGGMSWVVVPAGPPSPRGGSASRRRFPRAGAGANVSVTFDVTSTGEAGMVQESPLGSHPAGDLHAAVLAICIRARLWRNPSCFASMSGGRSRDLIRRLQELRNPRPLLKASRRPGERHPPNKGCQPAAAGKPRDSLRRALWIRIR